MNMFPFFFFMRICDREEMIHKMYVMLYITCKFFISRLGQKHRYFISSDYTYVRYIYVIWYFIPWLFNIFPTVHIVSVYIARMSMYIWVYSYADFDVPAEIPDSRCERWNGRWHLIIVSLQKEAPNAALCYWFKRAYPLTECDTVMCV